MRLQITVPDLPNLDSPREYAALGEKKEDQPEMVDSFAGGPNRRSARHHRRSFERDDLLDTGVF